MRPKLLQRVTFRLPDELLHHLVAHAERRGCSLNEVILNGLENECLRLAMYRLDFYRDVWISTVTLVSGCRKGKGDNVRQSRRTSANVSKWAKTS